MGRSRSTKRSCAAAAASRASSTRRSVESTCPTPPRTASSSTGPPPPGGLGPSQRNPSAEETVDGAPDWRGLLDLLDDQTGKAFGDLWQKWVARPQDLVALDARATTRAAYAQTVRLAGDWRLPISIRDAMRAWRFDVAVDLLAAADQVLGQRATLAAAASAADVKLPDSLRTAFEGRDGLPAAAAEAASEQSAVEM